jgi:hypothetical protein
MDYVFVCLHCQEPFIVSHKEFNCRILRHGVYKHNMQPIPPHASKEECDALVRDDLIFGCGRPLQIIEKDVGTDSPGSAYNVIICDYL